MNAELWTDLCEKSDRTSPEGYPNMALITQEEFFDYLNCVRAAVTEEALDAAAQLIELTQIAHTSDGDVVEGRLEGNRAGLAYAAAIRSIKLPGDLDDSAEVPLSAASVRAVGLDPSQTLDAAISFDERQELRTSLAAAVMSKAAEDVIAERERQKSEECWTEAHDDDHNMAQMALAAACYASPVPIYTEVRQVNARYEPHSQYLDAWPWASKWWKPKNRRRDLVRAGALILAEIERLDRAEARPGIASVPGEPRVRRGFAPYRGPTHGFPFTLPEAVERPEE